MTRAMNAAWINELCLRIDVGHDAGGRALRAARAIRDIPGVAAARSTLGFVCVRVDASRLDHADAIERAAIEAASASLSTDAEPAPNREIVIPVCHDPDLAPDLEPLARELGLRPRALADLHARPAYHASFLGFAPGFAYLTGVDPRLFVPRLASPRLRVEPGSVAIAGGYAGIYPHASPGGWRIIGRTPLRMFDAKRERPSLIEPGDRVRFIPIPRAEFDAHRENALA